jgi:hypothetical protein
MMQNVDPTAAKGFVDRDLTTPSRRVVIGDHLRT